MPSHLSWVTNLSQSHPYIRRSWEEHPRCSASQQFTLFLEALGKCSVFQVSFFFFLTSLLEYNCFTMVCYFLLYDKVNQLYIYVCLHISSLLHLPPSHPPYPTPLGGHKALS